MPNFPMGLKNGSAGADLQNLSLNHQNSIQTNDSQKAGHNLMVSFLLIYLFRSWMLCVLQCCHEAMRGRRELGGSNSEKRHDEIEECEASWEQVEESPVNSQRLAWNQGRENGWRSCAIVPGFGNVELGGFCSICTRHLERKTKKMKVVYVYAACHWT